MSKIYAFITIFLLAMLPQHLRASDEIPVSPADTTVQAEGVKLQGIQFAKKSTATKQRIPLLSGYGISADLAGAGMAAVGKWGQYEVGAHLGIYRRFFPTVELGVGTSNYAAERSGLHYKVHSPYFRVGMDYSLNKNRESRNRYFVGVRYGFSKFSYDLDGPDIKDAYWPYEFAYSRHGIDGSMHWGELLFGIQTQIWRFIHCGWTVRYKCRLHESQGEPGHAYYVPGYGKNGSSSKCFGGTFVIVFEL